MNFYLNVKTFLLLCLVSSMHLKGAVYSPMETATAFSPFEWKISGIQGSSLKGQSIWGHVGLFYPFILATGVHIPNKNFESYLQWTVFEEFRLPALAFRGGFSSEKKLKYSIVASWGLGPISIYGVFEKKDPSLGLEWQMIPGRLFITGQMQSSGAIQGKMAISL